MQATIDNKKDVPPLFTQNIVSTFVMRRCGEKMCLDELTRKVPFVEFNSKRFAAAVMRLVKPKTTCLFFASGKAVCTGAKTFEDSMAGAKAHIDIVRSFGVEAEMLEFSIQNIVNVTNCGFTLNLLSMSEQCKGIVSYEPDLFPGLSYRDSNWEGVVISVFASGKCVVTGAKTQEKADECWESFYTNILSKQHCVTNNTNGNQRLLHRSQETKKPIQQVLSMICNRVGSYKRGRKYETCLYIKQNKREFSGRNNLDLIESFNKQSSARSTLFKGIKKIISKEISLKRNILQNSKDNSLNHQPFNHSIYNPLNPSN